MFPREVSGYVAVTKRVEGFLPKTYYPSLSLGAFYLNRHMAKSAIHLNFLEANWMIQLGQAARHAERVVIKNFDANSTSISFVRSITADNSLFVKSCGPDLILEKIQST